MALNGTWLTQFPIKPCGSVNFRVIQRSAAISAMSAFCKILLPCISKFNYKPLLLPKRYKEIKLRVTTLPVFFFELDDPITAKKYEKSSTELQWPLTIWKEAALFTCVSSEIPQRIRSGSIMCWLSLPVTAVCVTFTVTLSKIKIKTLQYIKSRIREMKGGKYIKPSLRFRSMQFFIRNIP